MLLPARIVVGVSVLIASSPLAGCQSKPASAVVSDAGNDSHAGNDIKVAAGAEDAANDSPGSNDGPSGEAVDGPRRVAYGALAISSGKYHTCVLLDDHNIKCWGDNFYGQLGLDDRQTRGKLPAEMGDNLPVVDLGVGRRARAIAAGGYNTCAILDDGAVKCWGYGLGPKDDNRGDEPGEMGDNLPTTDLGAGRSAKIVGVAVSRQCGLLDDDTVKCWGGARVNPAPVILPRGPKVIDLAEARGMCALLDDGTVYRLDFEGAASTPVEMDGRATFVTGHETHGRAVLETGAISWWGANFMGTSSPNNLGSVLSMGQSFQCGMDDKGLVRCTGGLLGSLTTLDLPKPAIALSKAGVFHTCAILDDRSVRCLNGGPSTNQSWLGGSSPLPTGWPAVDLGTRPAGAAGTTATATGDAAAGAG